MPQSLITVNGGTNRTTSADLPINTLVQLNNSGIGGETTYAWSIIDQPAGTADALSSTSIINPTLTPRKEGTYLLQLIVNGDVNYTSRVAVGIRHLKTRIRVPAAGETLEVGARGWAMHANETHALLDKFASNGHVIVAQIAGSSVAINSVVQILDFATIKSGLPGEEQVPTATQALATSADVLVATLGLVLGPVDGSSSGSPYTAGTLVRVGTVATRYLAGYAASLGVAAGSALYLSNLGSPSATPGTNVCVIGTAHTNGLTFQPKSSGSVTGLSSTPPSAVGTTAVGVATTVARADHVHAHGNQAADAAMHAAVTTTVAGFMSAEDKLRFDSVLPSGSLSPAIGTPQIGSSQSYARYDHNHAFTNMVNNLDADNFSVIDLRSVNKRVTSVTFGATVTIDLSAGDNHVVGAATSNFAISITNLQSGQHGTIIVRQDATGGRTITGITAGANPVYSLFQEIHPTINYATTLYYQVANDGSYVVITSSVAMLAVNSSGRDGYMQSADKAKLDGIASGATNLALSSTTPAAVGTAAVGVGTTAARSDHVHAHGDQTGGTLHAAATTSVAGFMTAADKTKLDGISASAAALSSTTPANVSNAGSVGVGTTAARADHVHAITQLLGTLTCNGVLLNTVGHLIFSELAPAFAATMNVNLSAVSVVRFTATANFVMVITGHRVVSGTWGYIEVRQDATGGHTLTGITYTGGAYTIMYPDGQVPRINPAANSVTMLRWWDRGDMIVFESSYGTPLTTSAPTAVGSTSVGVGTTAARSDHVHAHGDQAGGALHALAVAAGAAGFMSGSDKTKLDGIEAGATNMPYSAVAGAAVSAAAGVVGVATSAARGDHTHAVTVGSPVAVGVAVASSDGTATSLARSDHVHALPVATTIAAGAMSAADKTKLDGITSGATALALTAVAPQSVGTANAVGTGAAAAREDHVHSHDNQAGGALHALAVAAGAAGFMSGADKTKLDGVASGATNTSLSSVTPSAVGTAAPGVATAASRYDHVHAHGAQAADATMHAAATTSVAGFMTAADKTKIDGIATGATANAASASVPTPVGIAANGAQSQYARGDHAHALTTFANSVSAGGYNLTSVGNLQSNENVAPFSATIGLNLPGFDYHRISGMTSNFNINLFTPANGRRGVVEVTQGATPRTLLTMIHGGATPVICEDGGVPLLDPAANSTTLLYYRCHPGGISVRSSYRPMQASASAPLAVGTASAGVAATVSRSDHVHAHGNQAGGTLHAVATTSVAGFMSSFDKAVFDAMTPSATVQAIGVSSVGSATTYSRGDHRHALDNLANDLDADGYRISDYSALQPRTTSPSPVSDTYTIDTNVTAFAAIIATGNFSITLSGAAYLTGASGVIEITQDATGGRSITNITNSMGATLKYPRGRAPVIDPKPSSVTYLKWTLGANALLYVTSSYFLAGARLDVVQGFGTGTWLLDYNVVDSITIYMTGNCAFGVSMPKDGVARELWLVNQSGADRTWGISVANQADNIGFIYRRDGDAPNANGALSTIYNGYIAKFTFRWIAGGLLVAHDGLYGVPAAPNSSPY